MSEKVKLPREVAEAMNAFIPKYKYSLSVLSQISHSNNTPETPEGIVLYDFIYEAREHNFDLLARAIIFEYEVEETPEEKIWDFYHTKASCDMHPHHAIQHILNILNIKIEGVNA